MSSTPPGRAPRPDLPPPTVPPPPRVVETTRPWGAPQTRPGDDHRVDVTLLDGIALVAWSSVGVVLIFVIVGWLAVLAGVDPTGLAEGPSATAVGIVVQSGTLAGALAWLAGRRRLTWRLLGSRRPRLVHVLQGLGWGLLALAASAVVVLVGAAVTGSTDDSGQALLDSGALDGIGLWLALVSAGLLAPVVEEVVYRGVLFQAVGRRIGWIGGMLVSSAVFALVHVEVLVSGGNAVVFVAALFAVGCVFALAFNRSRDLVAAITAHAVFNGAQLLLVRLTDVV